MNHRVNHNLELVSIHIPKTGGSSFEDLLRKNYGEKAVLRLDFAYDRTDPGNPVPITKNQTDPEVLNAIIQKGKLPDQIKVLHGHFSYRNFNTLFEDSPTISFISWLRHPIDRIISNYNYLNAILEKEMKISPKGKKVLNRLKRTAGEFAAIERNVNLYAAYLKDAPLDSYRFIGIMEHLETEVQQLAKILNWSHCQIQHINKTPTTQTNLEAQELESIYASNIDNLEIYNKALELRTLRMNS